MSQEEQVSIFQRIDNTVLEFEAAIKNQNHFKIFECIQSLESYMKTLDDYMFGNMYVPNIKTIFEIAKAHDVVYKISGAGGGDNVLLFLKDQKVYTDIKQTLPSHYLDITKFITGETYE